MKASDILPDDQNQLVRDGVVVRKGTVGAFLINAKIWCSSSPGSEDRIRVETDMVEALPSLRAMGVFDVFQIRDDALRQWLGGP